MRFPIFLLIFLFVFLFWSNGVSAKDGIPVKRYAFLVGIDKYKQLHELNYCAADTRRLGAVLAHCGFEKIVVVTEDDKLYKDRILEEFSELLKQIEAGNENLLLVAFSGHGFQKDDKRFLCPINAEQDTTEKMINLETDIYSRLTELEKEKRLHHCIFLLDACRNAPTTEKAIWQPNRDNQLTVDANSLPTELNLCVLSSCTAGNVSHELPDLKQGLFMYYVAEGLEGPAKNRHGEINVNSLHDFVEKEMAADARRRKTAPQVPTLSASAKGEQTKNIALAVPQGVSYWPKRPYARGPLFSTAFADLVQFPGLSGQWWGEEIPWYLPFVRLAVARRLESLPDLRDVALYPVDSFGTEFTGRMNYHSSDVAEAYGWLADQMVPACSDFLTNDAAALMNDVLFITRAGCSGDSDSGKQFFELAKKCQKIRDTMNNNSVVQKAVLLHSQAVLLHLAVLNGSDDLETVKMADEKYRDALKHYDGRDAQTKAPLLFIHSCLSDYIRFLRRAEGILDNAATERRKRFDRLQGDVSAGKAGQSLLFHAELLTTCASYGNPKSTETEILFQQAEQLLQNMTVLKNDHPLRAYYLERRGWNLLNAWRSTEAEDHFQQALKIRNANLLPASTPISELYAIHNRHGTAVARRLQGRITGKETLPDRGKSGAGARRGAGDSFGVAFDSLAECSRKRMTQEIVNRSRYDKMLNERFANTCERWGDCAIYGGIAELLARRDTQGIQKMLEGGNDSITAERLYATAYRTAASEGVALVFAAKLALAKAMGPTEGEDVVRLCEAIRSSLLNDGSQHTMVNGELRDDISPTSEFDLVRNLPIDDIVKNIRETTRTMISPDDRIRANLICRLAEIVCRFEQSPEQTQAVCDELRAFLRLFRYYANDPGIAKNEITEIGLFALELLLHIKMTALETATTISEASRTDAQVDLAILDWMIRDFAADTDRYVYARRFFVMGVRLCHLLLSDVSATSNEETPPTFVDGASGRPDPGHRNSLEEVYVKLLHYVKTIYHHSPLSADESLVASRFTGPDPPSLHFECLWDGSKFCEVSLPSNAPLPIYRHVRTRPPTDVSGATATEASKGLTVRKIP